MPAHLMFNLALVGPWLITSPIVTVATYWSLSTDYVCCRMLQPILHEAACLSSPTCRSLMRGIYHAKHSSMGRRDPSNHCIIYTTVRRNG